jgi:hypothetical protein
MSQEVTVNASLEYSDSEGSECPPLELTNFFANVTTKRFVRLKQNIGTSEEAIKLGELTTLGWAMFINRDLTNFINIKVATGGAIFAKLFPGECCGPLRLGSGAQAPFAIADTAACQMDVLIIEV